MPAIIDFTRIKRLIDARNIGPDEAAKVEQVIAEEIVDSKVLAHDVATRPTAHPENFNLRPFQAAEALSVALDRVLVGKVKGKYDPKYALPRTVNDLWQVRQAIDQLGLPYTFYVDEAVPYVGKPKGRSPRLSQLVGRDVVTHVTERWVGRR